MEGEKGRREGEGEGEWQEGKENNTFREILYMYVIHVCTC